MDLWDLSAVDVEPRKPVVLHSDEGAARIVAINLEAGDALEEHQVHEHAWLLVHDGEVEVAVDGTPQTLGAGSFVHWEPGERHFVRGRRDARLYLMLAPWPGPGHPRLPRS